MSKLSKKIFTGQIVDILDKHTSTGKFLVEFRARTEDDKLYVCTIWEKDAERFFSSIRLGEKVHLEGYEKSENEISIKYFKSKDVLAGRSVNSLNSEDIKEYQDNMRANGYEFIQIPTKERGTMTISKLRRYCIRVNGVWEGKMEYCIKVLGGDFITDALRDFGDPAKPGSLANSANPASFKKLLEDLVALAADQTGDTIERAEEDVDYKSYLSCLPPVGARAMEFSNDEA